MAQLIKPNRKLHKYVVGIDFGHGETSAAICPIEWDTIAGKKEDNFMDIDLDSNAKKKVITSAICRSGGKTFIGEEAFEHTDDNTGIRVGFKQKPTSDGEQERLMTDYMEAVYARIRKIQDELTDENHIVYIARPSGWNDEEAKEMYRQMALNAGIPLAGLTSESRAAIFYAKTPAVSFSKVISSGAMVFDLGSSTLDFTYLSDNDNPIDNGYNLGASIIDEAIFKYMILNQEDILKFLTRYPIYHDALLFKARKFKETAYSRNESSKTVINFSFDSIISEEAASYNDYSEINVKLKISNLEELNNLVATRTNYMANIKKALEDFRDNYISGKQVNGVFLTGGASRMNFIPNIIAEVFGLNKDQIRIDNDNPSLTISRGIALLGTADAITSVLVEGLKKKLPEMLGIRSSIISNTTPNPIESEDSPALTDTSALPSTPNITSSTFKPDFHTGLARQIADDVTKQAWNVVERTSNNWIANGRSTNQDELKSEIEASLNSFRNNGLKDCVNHSIESFVHTKSEDIRKRMNDIISLYAPGREISVSENIDIADINALNGSMEDLSKIIKTMCDSLNNMLGKIILYAILYALFGVWGLIVWVIDIFRSDEAKRRGKVKKLLNKKNEIFTKIKQKIISELEENENFKETVNKSVQEYLLKVFNSNLQKVIIPIE